MNKIELEETPVTDVESRSPCPIREHFEDVKEAIKSKVAKKVEKSNLPATFKGIATKQAGNIAIRHVKPSTVAEKMSSKLCRKLPKKMKEKGVTVVIEEVFRKGPYFVLELQVQHVDTIALRKSKEEDTSRAVEADEEAGTNTFAGTLIEWSLKLIGSQNQRRLEEGFLAEKVQSKLKSAMISMMATKFSDNQIKADINVLKEDKQARYFYARLRKVKAAMPQNPIQELRKKLSSDTSIDADDLDNSSSDGF